MAEHFTPQSGEAAEFPTKDSSSEEYDMHDRQKNQKSIANNATDHRCCYGLQ